MREAVAWTLAALALILAVVAVLRPRPIPAPERMRFILAPPTGYSFFDTVQLSPDGKRVLLVMGDAGGTTSLWVRSLDELDPRRLAGTDHARNPFWSYDGGEIAYFVHGKLKRVGAGGGPAQTICDGGSGFVGSWGPAGTILFTPEFGTNIFAVAVSGGT
jgi:hypothetical protein